MTRQTPASVMNSYSSALPMRHRQAPASASGYPTENSTADECCRCQATASSSSSFKPEAYTKPFCDFLSENPTVFHAVDYFKNELHHAGFEQV